MVIDTSGYYGSWPYWKLRHGSPQQILGLMDRYHIDKVLLCSTKAIFYDWEEGNEDLLKITSEHADRFIPSLVLNPVYGSDVCENTRKYVQKGVKSLRLFPLYHSYRLANEYILERLVSAMEESDIIITVPIRLIMNWAMPVLLASEFEALVTNSPQRPIVASGISYGELYSFFPLLKKYHHLYLETSCLQTRGSIEQMASLFGTDRILMGTGLPIQNPGIEMAKQQALDLPDKDKKRILGENARRLFGI